MAACGGKKAPEAATPDTTPAEVPASTAPKLSADKLVERALKKIESGTDADLEAAIRDLESAVEQEPDNLEARINLGVAKQKRGDLPGARQAYEAVLAADPTIAQAHLYLGAIDEQQNNLAAAVSRYRQGMSAAPEDMALRVALIGALRKQGKPAEAIEESKAALAINANSIEVYNNFGLAYMDQGNLTLARFILQKALQSIPEAESNAYIHTNLGWVSYLDGNVPLATSELKKAVELDDELVPALVYLARIYMDDKNYADTVPLLESATERDPTNADLYLTLGVAYRGVGRLDDAEAAYKKALELDPADPSPHFNLGVLLGDFKKDYDGAVDAFNTYVQAGGDKSALATEYISEVEKEKKRAERRQKALEDKRKRDEERAKEKALLEEAKKKEEAEAAKQPAPEPDAPSPEGQATPDAPTEPTPEEGEQ
jgi:Flp pilus assembly protein TadD